MQTTPSDAFKALGQPHRLEIMRRLLARSLSCCETTTVDDCSLDPTCCNFGELADDLAIDKATVSHHLKELERTGLIERLREGRRVYVRANLETVEALRTFLDVGTHSDAVTDTD